ncbi:hypothetical protein [Carboxylicivirga sp. N1Y90]|uniref:hypothetical protein n=1 Tax=Carboxylicivirga fragile TaxID=3417571 RepID=UPI003D351C1B|nr:hypothetical protein [Marinilabiliaceae bacterium N1Y90]
MYFTLDLKIALHQQLNAILEEKINAVRVAMQETSESMKNDTKSSAGDKFETGREMMQIELNNQQMQLGKLLDLQKDISKIELDKAHAAIAFGSLVKSSMGFYFVSVAMGKIDMDGSAYYALSLASPIGKALKDKRVADVVTFQGKSIEILELV